MKDIHNAFARYGNASPTDPSQTDQTLSQELNNFVEQRSLTMPKAAFLRFKNDIMEHAVAVTRDLLNTAADSPGKCKLRFIFTQCR